MSTEREAEFKFPARSVTVPIGRVTITSPSQVTDVTILKVVPSRGLISETLSRETPAAVDAETSKSLGEIDVGFIASENVAINCAEARLVGSD